MKLLPYMVGMNFGEGQDGQLYVLGLLAPSNELACAHAVSTVMQMAKIEKPLARIIWQELEEAFLVEALKGLRGEAGGDTKVVSLRAVEPDRHAESPPSEVPANPIAEPLVVRPLSDGAQYVNERGAALAATDAAPALHHWVRATLSDRPGYACMRCGVWREETEPGGGTCVRNLRQKLRSTSNPAGHDPA